MQVTHIPIELTGLELKISADTVTLVPSFGSKIEFGKLYIQLSLLKFLLSFGQTEPIAAIGRDRDLLTASLADHFAVSWLTS
jgi:hypothetical protein